MWPHEFCLGFALKPIHYWGRHPNGAIRLGQYVPLENRGEIAMVWQVVWNHFGRLQYPTLVVKTQRFLYSIHILMGDSAVLCDTLWNLPLLCQIHFFWGVYYLFESDSFNFPRPKVPFSPSNDQWIGLNWMICCFKVVSDPQISWIMDRSYIYQNIMHISCNIRIFIWIYMYSYIIYTSIYPSDFLLRPPQITFPIDLA